MRTPTPDHIPHDDPQQELYPERPPPRILIHIAVVVTVATFAQALANLWAILTWPPVFAAALVCSAYSRIRPNPTIFKMRDAIRSIPGSPSRALHRALERFTPRIPAQHDPHEE